MNTEESKTQKEELEHLKEVKEPEDFEHPEPDARQPEAKAPAKGLQRVLPIVIAVLGILVAAMLIYGVGD